VSKTIFPIMVGQKVFASPGGNAAYYHAKAQYLEGTIVRITKKYFYVKFNNYHSEEKFELSTFDSKCGDCNAYYTLYASLQELQNELEKAYMWNKLRNLFSYGSDDKVTYEKVKAVYNIICDGGSE